MYGLFKLEFLLMSTRSLQIILQKRIKYFNKKIFFISQSISNKHRIPMQNHLQNVAEISGIFLKLRMERIMNHFFLIRIILENLNL